MPNVLVPPYANVRRKGYHVHDPQDLTEEFFAPLLERNYVIEADHNKRKLRRVHHAMHNKPSFTGGPDYRFSRAV